MDARGQMTFYRSYFEALSSLPKKDRLAAYEAIIAYGLDGTEPKLSGVSLTAFILAKPTLDAGRRKAKSGKAGGESKGNGKQTESKPEANQKELKANGKQTEREKEREKEKEIEIEIEGEIESNLQATPPDADYIPSVEDAKTIQRAWNDMGIPQVRQVLSLTTRQKDGLREALKAHGVGGLLGAIEKVRNSEFLTGKKTGFTINFDWFLRPENLEKILSGAYDGRKNDVPKGASGRLGDAELEAIQRVLKEGQNDV